MYITFIENGVKLIFSCSWTSVTCRKTASPPWACRKTVFRMMMYTHFDWHQYTRYILR